MLLPIPAMAQWHRIFCRLKRGDFGGVPTSPQDRNREGAEAEQGPLIDVHGWIQSQVQGAITGCNQRM